MTESDFKLVLVGDKYVGKTSVFNRCVYDKFETPQLTVEAYFALTMFKITEKCYKIALWDTAGEEKFDALTKFYIRGAHCAVICFDLTNRATFAAVKKWAKLIDDDCILMILGNKLDLEESGEKDREITAEEGKVYAAQINAIYREGSAVTGAGISEAFKDLLTDCIEQFGGSLQHQKTSINLDEVFVEKQRKRCC